MSRNLARIVISADMLHSWLCLPKGAAIRRICVSHEDYYVVPRFEIIVEHPDLPYVHDGCMIPIACPAIETDYVAVPKFKSWGIGGK